ncbi:MAG TPA: hypothetical protein VGI81_12465 [Tepidisphaeraceae bacterium]|jgi:hypothetical protein
MFGSNTTRSPGRSRGGLDPVWSLAALLLGVTGCEVKYPPSWYENLPAHQAASIAPADSAAAWRADPGGAPEPTNGRHAGPASRPSSPVEPPI